MKKKQKSQPKPHKQVETANVPAQTQKNTETGTALQKQGNEAKTVKKRGMNGSRSPNATALLKSNMLKALQSTLGIVTSALQMLEGKVSRTQYYEWVRTDAQFAEEVAHVKDMQLDFAESQLMKKVKLDDTTAIIFYLKTQGKGRGYIERSETAILGAIKTNITIE